MGGDAGPRPIAAACNTFLRQHPSSFLTVIGHSAEIKSLLTTTERVTLVDASSAVTNADKPAHALRNKFDSSMSTAVQMVADRAADACVSAGNTGALMAFGLRYLGTLSGISRPAICKPVPNRHGCCLLLDLGANIDCSAEQLGQFALMGAAMARVAGKTKPKVGLLNVGREAQKGGDLQRQAAQMIAALGQIDYIGYVEGGDVFLADVDVVVCDGFTGNALLKASEGAAALLRDQLDQSLRHGWAARCARLLISPYLYRWRSVYDPARYNGAVLLGLCGVVVKSHGSADAAGFEAALQVAYEHAASETPAQIAASMV